MGIKGYKVYDRKKKLCDTLIGTQPRKWLNKLRMKGYKVIKIQK